MLCPQTVIVPCSQNSCTNAYFSTKNNCIKPPLGQCTTSTWCQDQHNLTICPNSSNAQSTSVHTSRVLVVRNLFSRKTSTGLPTEDCWSILTGRLKVQLVHRSYKVVGVDNRTKVTWHQLQHQNTCTAVWLNKCYKQSQYQTSQPLLQKLSLRLFLTTVFQANLI